MEWKKQNSDDMPPVPMFKQGSLMTYMSQKDPKSMITENKNQKSQIKT